jgi:hypothetical protein
MVAKPIYGSIEASFKITVIVSSPQAPLELLPGHQFAWMSNKQGENFNGLTGKLQPNPILAQFSGLNRQLERAESHRRRHTVLLG